MGDLIFLFSSNNVFMQWVRSVYLPSSPCFSCSEPDCTTINRLDNIMIKKTMKDQERIHHIKAKGSEAAVRPIPEGKDVISIFFFLHKE